MLCGGTRVKLMRLTNYYEKIISQSVGLADSVGRYNLRKGSQTYVSVKVSQKSRLKTDLRLSTTV